MKFAAFDLSRNNVGFYLAALPASELYKISRVERISENPEEGFQRQLDIPKSRKIATYLREKVIPGAIILSAQQETEIIYHSSSGELELKSPDRSLLVIDGQHRLYGAHLASEKGVDVLLPVCILTNLSRLEEVQYFIDINSTQKGVPKTLRIELTKFLAEQGSIEQIRLRLFKELNSDPESVLFGKLSAEQRGPGYLSHVPFEIAINKILELPRVKGMQYEDQKTLISNYLYGVDYNLKENGFATKLTQSAFFQAIFRVFNNFCEQALIIGQNYKKETFVKAFECLGKIDFEHHTGTNEDAISRLEKDLIDKLEISRYSTTASSLF